MNKITVSWSKEHQPIDGFGVCGAFMQARNLQTYPQADQQQILDALFSRTTGAGVSMIRNIVGDSGTWGNEEDGPTPSIMPRKGELSETGDDDQIWFMKEAARRGCDRFVSSVWSPPAWMKTTGDVTRGGELKPECYADFAEYIVQYVRLYRERHGLPIYALSPSNEPDYVATYSSCLWTAAQFYEFYHHHLGPAFKRAGVTTLTFGPETMFFGNDVLRKYAGMFEGRGGLPEIAAMHGYGESVVEPLDRAVIGDRKIWMSELCEIDHPMNTGCDPSLEDGLRVARNVHRYLAQAGANAYIYFWGMSKYDNNSALVRLDLEKRSFVLCKRLFTFGQFSRFIRPGFLRIDAKHDCGDGILISAYKGEGGKLAVVAVNPGESTCDCSLEGVGFNVPRLLQYVTDQTRDLAFAGAAAPGGTVTLPARSVVTFAAE